LEPRSNDPMRHSIALKIFALAAGIAALTVVVAILTNIEVAGLGADLSFVARQTIPLASDAADLNESGLFRRVAFECLYREYGEPEPDEKVIHEARASFDQSTEHVFQQVKRLREGLKVLPDDPQEAELVAQAREVVGQIEGSFRTTTALAERTLAARRAGERAKAKEILDFAFIGQVELRAQRSQLQHLLGELALLSARKAEARKNWVLFSSAATAALAVVLGLWVAWLISRNLARPVNQLLQSTRKVRDGDLNFHVGKMPEDELGQLGDSFNAMVDELKKKETLQRAIGSYIDPRIVEKVILPGRPEDVAGQKRVMTVLFTDLVGFTTLGENLTPGGLVNVINRYFTVMSHCVQKERGIIDKFIGDAVMAYWGPPFVAEEEQAVAACRAALKQREALQDFRRELPELMGLRKNLPEINLRIGLSTGEVIVGNIGSDTARSYTVMGDVVNLASRLESANNVYGTSILITDDTRRLAHRFIETREIDRLTVKGKTEPVVVYELLAEAGQLTTDWAYRKTQFEAGLEAYRQQDWRTAVAIFQELSDKYADSPSAVFLTRIASLREHPPGPNWDGVWRLSGK
jgi:adenylate cyclase